MSSLKKIIYIAARLVAGLVFVFSGFVKAVDPLGSTYKFIDYFNAFNMPWLESTAFPLSITLSGLEFLTGMCLLLFLQNKLATWAALLFMFFFTPLTLWLALTNPVHDCGCFGDAFILTNWQTFYKNLIILVFVVMVFKWRGVLKQWVNLTVEWIITLAIAILITSFSLYNYQHLPVLDFRPYKTGTYIPDKMGIPEGAPADVYEQYFTLFDTVTGKQLTIESALYMKDTALWKQGTTWKFVSAADPVLVKKGYEPPIHDFSIESSSEGDITQSVLADTGYYFLLVAYDLNKTRQEHLNEINTLYENAVIENNKFICLTSAAATEIEKFREAFNIPYEFYITDPITLKTIIRANPGLVLLHKGTVLAKWHSNDIPEYESIKQKYIKP